MAEIKSPKKLIEVALPLDDINVAAAKEKSIRHGHPSTLHMWWARRPLAAARAVIFAQMVNDPGYDRSLKRGLKKEDAQRERERLFQIIRDLVKWENINNEEVLEKARVEIRKSWQEICELNKDHPQAAGLFDPNKLPAFHDPFAGGGTIPLEAQRLGLDAWASDLNPVAVTINKAMIEIPPKFAQKPPVGPLPKGQEIKQDLFHRRWTGVEGLAEDVRRYGAWMRNEAYKRIGHLYPQIEITKEMIKDRNDLKNLLGKKLTVIAWIWTRTVKSPNPAYSHVDVPLSTTFILSSKVGEEAWVEPIIEDGVYRFVVRIGKPPKGAERGTKSGGSGSNFLCLISKTPMDFKYLRQQAKNGCMGARLLTIVAEGPVGRVYLSPTSEHEKIATMGKPTWRPDIPLPERALGFRIQEYGMIKWSDLFTSRQLIALSAFSSLVKDAIAKCKQDSIMAGLTDDGKRLEEGGTGATAYSEAVGIYLAFAVDYGANYWSSIATPAEGFIRGTFARQALPMTWDFAEAPPFGTTSGNWLAAIDWIARAINAFPFIGNGISMQADAATQNLSLNKVVSTDPPYYNNIGYADLSDFFYVWLRHSLQPVFPSIFATLVVPKIEELVAVPYRHGGREQAEDFFLNGMIEAMHRLSEQAHPAFPVTIYYAFKQAETENEAGTSSTGWETFLEAVLRAGFSLVGTWPMRTERSVRSVGIGTNALASSIILVCKRRATSALTVSRREFLRELNAVLPEALLEITHGIDHSPVAPVDLSQAIIGPGMAVFSKYTAVLEADGNPMTVRAALQLINRFLAEDDFDHDTQFSLHWFETFGWGEDKFGEADVLARAKGTTVDGVRESGVIEAKSGKVRLLKFAEYPDGWNPTTDKRVPIWEALHHLIRAFRSGGESVAGSLLSRMITKSEAIRQLAYRLYTLCERKGWADDARAYNELITSWEAIESASHAAENAEKQKDLFNTGEVNVA